MPAVTPARLQHLALEVADTDRSIAFYRDVLGLTPSAPVTADGARIVSVQFGDVEVELMQPETTDGPVSRFLARRGPGIHHICYHVPDLEAALAACRRQGYRLIDEAPRPGAGGRRVAFVHPKATGGILLELTD